jgi:hypothetical protein
MNRPQLPLFSPWWSETDSTTPIGSHVWLRYRCRRCGLWSDLVDSRKEPPGSCAKCVPLPLGGAQG